MWKLGIDIGGTFTDFVLLNTVTGERLMHKVLTTPRDPAAGAIQGVESILKTASLRLADIRHVIHGTTLVVNAIIERKGCRAGLLTTEGFRDVLEMRRGRRFDIDDLLIEVPDPLVPRQLVLEIRERMNKDGVPVTPFDRSMAMEVVREMVSTGVEAVAVSFLHSYRNADHEVAVEQIIRKLAPQMEISLSSRVAPDLREYERTSTTVANAYVQPVMRSYLDRLEKNLGIAGYRNDLYLMLSDAGLTTAASAGKVPIRIMESGPAGGTVMAEHISERLGLSELVAFDMGGTTAKISFIADGKILKTGELEIARRYRFKRGSGLPIRIPVVQIMEIGAGGGGIASVNEVGLMQVGPESAGADPGPACYDRGGTQPTVTDANLLLGYLNPDFFLGGRMRLSTEAAQAAVGKLARQLSLEDSRAAWGIHDIVSEDMAQAARLHLLERGADPRAFGLLAFGGAGPLHACRLARKLGIKEVIVPYGAGVASAFGFLVAPISITLLQAYPVDLRDVDFAYLASLFAALEQQGRAFLASAGLSEDQMRLRRYASLRYRGQGSELKVPVEPGRPDRSKLQKLTEAFHQEFARVYGRRNDAIGVEALNWQLEAAGDKPLASTAQIKAVGRNAGASPVLRPAFFPESGGFVTCPVYLRESLKKGVQMKGPALVEEPESTTVIPPHSTFSVDHEVNLRITL